MNIHEYQAKELLARFDLPILKGKVYFNRIKNNEEISKFIQGPPWVVKAQIHAGGRGAGKFKTDFNLKGGVKIIKDGKKLIDTANSMLGNILITKQTGQEGKKVNRVFIEEGCIIKREFYLSLLIDRKSSQIMLMISDAGGTDIEEVAESNTEKIHAIFF